MAGFCSENSKLKVSLIAKVEKQTSLRMSLTEALYTVHTSQLKPAPLVWYRILRVIFLTENFHWLRKEELELLKPVCS